MGEYIGIANFIVRRVDIVIFNYMSMRKMSINFL